MALRTLIANDRLTKIDERIKVLDSSLGELEELENSLQTEYLEKREDSDTVEDLFKRSQELDTKKEELRSEKTSLVEEKAQLEENIKEYSKGEEPTDMEVKNEKTLKIKRI